MPESTFTPRATTGIPPPGERLTRAHFRFLSGVIQGLDARVLWERYLFAHGAADLRRIRSVIALLQDELGARARQAGRPDVAALLRRRSTPIAPPSTSPTLDEFAATLPSADMHSEAELLALWKAAHHEAASPRPALRRQRLIERQLNALRWLETQPVVSPRPADPLSAWLGLATARRLSAVGIETPGDLRTWIDLHGHHWHRHVPRFGVRGADRVVRWLAGHTDTLGALPARALKPLSQIDVRTLAPAPAVGVVPLERLRLPPTLSGAHGSNRAEFQPPRPQETPALDDLEAVQAWLSRYPPATHTWRAYRREAERFLLWAVFERGKALSSLDGIDCAAFRDFLASPGAHWVSPRHVPRWSDRWRPLEGGLSPGSIATAVAIVRSLCGWLVRQRHLAVDPWGGAPQNDPSGPLRAPSRSLSAGDWRSLQQWLNSRARHPSADRLRALMTFACQTGLRESELAAVRTSWLRYGPGATGPSSWSLVVGADPGCAANRTLELSTELVRQLLDQLTITEVSVVTARPAVDQPLFAHRSDPTRALGPGRIYTLMKGAFIRCAQSIESTDPAAARRLRLASTHWLRNTHARHLAAAGVPLVTVQRRLGHRSRMSTAACLARPESG